MRLAGVIELNPGPYEIIKSVQGIFNQSNAAMFGSVHVRHCFLLVGQPFER